MKTVLASVAALALTLSMAGCSQSSAPGITEAAGLEGTWIGDNVGYENGEYQEREIRLVIDQSTGTAFAGEKSWREIGGKWSEAETFSGAVLDGTDFHAADSDGFISGTVTSPTLIQATYLEAGEDSGAFELTLEKVG